MSACICREWEEIHTFHSHGEYGKFSNWIKEQLKTGNIVEVPVRSKYANSEQFEESWCQCKGCGKIWRLVAPEFPFKGVFEPVEAEEKENSET